MRRGYLIWTFFGLGAAVVLLVALSVSPYLRVSTTPVVLTMHAPKESDILIRWAEDEEPIRMIPAGDMVSGWAWYWTTELPPRKSYQIAIIFQEPQPKATWASFEVIELLPKKHAVLKVEGIDTGAWQGTGISILEATGDRVHLSIDRGASIEIPEEILMNPSGTMLRTAWFNLGVLAVLGAALFGCGWRFPERSERLYGESFTPWGWGWLVIAFLLAAGVHWHLATTSMVDFWPADSTSYSAKAQELRFAGRFGTDSHEFELNRLPGYPLLMALAFRWIDHSLNAVVQVQTAIYLLSVAVFVVLNARMVRPIAWIIALPLMLWSPPVVWANRQIATESVFVSLSLLGAGLFLAAWARRGWTSWLLTAGFILVVGVVCMVRPNGVILLVMPGCAIVGWVVRHFQSEGFRGLLPGNHLSELIPWVLPFVVVMVLWGGWSYRNYQYRGYAHPTDLSPVVAANAPFNAGMLDARVFLESGEYDQIISDRWSQGYFYNGWAIRHTRFRRITDNWKKLDNETLTTLGNSLSSFVKQNNQHIDWRIRLAAWWRVLGWGFWFPDQSASTQEPLRADYTVDTDFINPGQEATLNQRLEWLGRVHPIISCRKGESSWLIKTYNSIVPPYQWVYKFLVSCSILILFGDVWIRKKAKVETIVLFAPFFVNLLLNVYFLFIVSRYVQVMDSCLILGIFSALFAWFGPRSDQGTQTT